MCAAMLAQLDQTMTKIFNPKLKRIDETLLPFFNGVKMRFLEDPAQLCPVVGKPNYAGDTHMLGKPERVQETKGKRQVNYHLTAKGQELYRKYLDGWSSVLRPRQHSIGYTRDGFYRSKDPTDSIKVLKGVPAAKLCSTVSRSAEQRSTSF